MTGLGLLFVAAGFFLIPTIAGAIIFWLLGGIIALNCFWLFLFPPVMLQFTPEGLSFGTGFRYRQFAIPWQHIVAIDYGINPSLTAHRELFGGVQVTVAEVPEVPASMITSAGVSYAFHRLTVHWLYANRFPWTVVKTGRQFLEKYRKS